MGWLLYFSADAASRSSSAGLVSPRGINRLTASWPVVSVPVLSKTKALMFAASFDVRDILDENAQPRRGGQRGHHRGGRGQNKRARTGHHEHRDHPVQVVRKGPDQRADDQHQRRVKAHVLVHDLHDRQLGLFRRQNQFAHPAQRGVLPARLTLISRTPVRFCVPAKTSSPGFLSTGNDSPVMVAWLNEPWPVTDQAVRRHVVARPDADDIADRQFAGGDFLLAAAF